MGLNSVTELLRIKYPIFQGGMGNISNAPLTAAVSEAGGLGTIGSGTMSPNEVENIIIDTKRRTSKPFSLNIAINVTPHVDALINLAIKHRLEAVTLSAGNPAPYIHTLHENNVKVIAVVASVKHAKKAEQAGVDILVAEGYEAAGINSNLEITTFTLVPQIVNAVSIPVVAAGGIGDGRGLAAAMMLGAQGIQIGTRLIATKEAPFHISYKEKLIQAASEETIILGRSVGRVRRVLKGDYADKIIKLEKQGLTLTQFNDQTSETYHKKGALEGNFKSGYVNSGQVVGLINDIPTVQELFDGFMNDATDQIRKVAQTFDTLEFN